MHFSYNYFGKQLTEDVTYLPLKDEYFDAQGNPRWELLQFAGDGGFDIRYRDAEGLYYKKIVLPAGKKIIRFGFDRGFFTADFGTPYNQLSLPYMMESVPYHEYTVLSDTEVLCYVDKGIVAPGFSSKGGAIQYRHYTRISDEIRRGTLREDETWISERTK